MSTALLNNIHHPADLRKLDAEALPQLCEELRAFYIDVISRKGGHFAAGLGAVELTVALHYVFSTPDDQLVWDVGHQAYVHKMLTGRLADFENIRRWNGISGFPKRDESPYDTFGTGHASTAISAALGMAIASQLKGEHLKQHIAVVGDGALTGGLAFEGLNNAGVSNANLLIILNDNAISIDPAVGALSQNTARHAQVMQDQSGIGDGRNRGRNPALLNERGIKAVNLGYQAFFESLGLPYTGVVDGHDLSALLEALDLQKSLKGPRVLHIKTLKGKGYAPAEQNQVQWHSPGKFDKLTGEILQKPNEGPTAPKFQDVFGKTLIELARQNPKIIGITPAMPSGSSLNLFMEAFPERAFDVGIAEEHAVTFSAGLATQGQIPFCNIYSTFLQRAYDQVIHDVALQNLHVVFCLDRAGLVGQDGPTHHGVFDMVFLRAIPNMVVAAPANEHDLRNLLYTATLNAGPFAIRYPRGRGSLVHWQNPYKRLAIGKSLCVKTGKNIAILAMGPLLYEAQKAIEQLQQPEDVGLYNMLFAKPLDTAMLLQIARQYQHIITLEDGAISGGFGSAVLEFYASQGQQVSLKTLGIPDTFIPHGKPQELYAHCGLDAEGILRAINSCLTQ